MQLDTLPLALQQICPTSGSTTMTTVSHDSTGLTWHMPHPPLQQTRQCSPTLGSAHCSQWQLCQGTQCPPQLTVAILLLPPTNTSYQERSQGHILAVLPTQGLLPPTSHYHASQTNLQNPINSHLLVPQQNGIPPALPKSSSLRTCSSWQP